MVPLSEETITLSQEEVSLRIRRELINHINEHIDRKLSTLNQIELSRRLHIAQPRVSLLRQGNIAKFSIDKLIELLTVLDREVKITIEVS